MMLSVYILSVNVGAGSSTFTMLMVSVAVMFLDGLAPSCNNKMPLTLLTLLNFDLEVNKVFT